MFNLVYLITGMINNFCEFYGYYKISDEKISFKSKKLYILYIIQTILIILNYTYTKNILKVTFTFLIMLFICKLLFSNKKIIDCFLITFICEFTIIISEFCFAIVMSLLMKVDNNTLIKIFQGETLANFIICVIMILFLLTKIPTKVYKSLKNILTNISVNKIIIFLSFVIFCASILFYISYYNKNQFLTLLVNFLITTTYFVIVIIILIEERKYNTINAKYLNISSDLKEYETMINEYRIINHENKNQLHTIKGMTKNKKLIEYIDELLNNKNSENIHILKQCLFIPAGGLRGLIYSKLLLMKSKGINYNLNIDKNISSKSVENISSKLLVDICKIIGVYLDNAIEAVENSKNKEILINLYFEKELCVEIINNVEVNVDLNKISKQGYSTKGNFRGYGLTLVNRILKHNSNLKNVTEINKNQFKQKLIIK